MFRTSLFAFAALGLAACASDGSTAANDGGRECFSADQVNSFEVVDDHTIRVRVSASRRYLLTTGWNANELDWSNAIAIRSTPVMAPICTGNGLGVQIIGGNPPRTFPVTGVSREPDPVPAGS